MRRTPEGVAVIRAVDELEFARELGRAHAKDRLLQLTLTRVIGEGRLSELLRDAPETRAVDLFMRKMGFAHGARREVELLAEARPLVEAYCAGVNERLAKARPLEYALAGYRPAPWTAADVLLTVRLMSYVNLAQTQQEAEKLVVESLRRGVAPEKLKRLFAPHLDGVTEELVALVKAVRFVEPFLPVAVPGVPALRASNNFAVAAARSVSGAALQANDPHLEVNRLPAIWYEVAGRVGDDLRLGVTVPGAPGLVMGRTGRISAGFTYGFMDMVDYFLEEVRGGRVRRGDSWREVEARDETILGKKDAPRTLRVFTTDAGVLETPDDATALEDGLYLARAWSFEGGGAAATVRALTALWGSYDVRTARLALHGCRVSANWLLADTRGSIAYQQTGALPARQHSGLHPVPAWEEKWRWHGLVPGGELATEVDPPAGLLVTANDEWNAPGAPLAVNLHMGDYRAARARTLLAAKEKVSLDDLKAAQRDLFSLQAERILEAAGPLLPDTEVARFLRSWDRRYDAGSKGAVLFERLYAALLEALFGEWFGAEAWRWLTTSTVVFAEYFVFFDRVLLEELAKRPPALTAAAARALDVDPASLTTWGEERRFTMTNLFFDGKLPRLLGFDRGPFALEGGRATLVQGQLFTAAGRRTSIAPSWRYVTDMGTEEAWTALAGGPSDRRFSRRYATDVDRWRRSAYKRLRL